MTIDGTTAAQFEEITAPAVTKEMARRAADRVVEYAEREGLSGDAALELLYALGVPEFAK